MVNQFEIKQRFLSVFSSLEKSGIIVKNIRQDGGMSYTEIAQITFKGSPGACSAQLLFARKGGTLPIEAAINFSRAFEIDLNWMVFGDGEPPTFN